MYYDPSGYFCEGKGNSFWDSKWGQGIKAGGQILGGFGQIAAGVAVTKLSFGLATPIGGYMMLHGAGNVWSGFRDSIDIMRGNEVKLGQYNFVKNAYTGIGGWIGGEKGASIGEYMYYGVDIAVSLIGIGLEIKNIIKVWQRVPSGIKLTNIRFGMSEQLYKTVLSPYYPYKELRDWKQSGTKGF